MNRLPDDRTADGGAELGLPLEPRISCPVSTSGHAELGLQLGSGPALAIPELGMQKREKFLTILASLLALSLTWHVAPENSL